MEATTWIQTCFVALISTLWARLVWTQNRRDTESREEINALRTEIVKVRGEIQTAMEHLGQLTTLAKGVRGCPLQSCSFRALAGHCLPE